MLFFNIESCLFPQDFEGCFLLWQNETVFLPPGQVLKALSSYIIHHTTFSNCTLPLRLGIQTEAADPHPCRSLWFAKRHLGRCWCSDAQRRGSQWQISMWWPQFVGGVENQSRVSFGFFFFGRVRYNAWSQEYLIWRFMALRRLSLYDDYVGYSAPFFCLAKVGLWLRSQQTR